MRGNSKLRHFLLMSLTLLFYQNCGNFSSNEQGLEAGSSALSGVQFKCTDDSLASETKSLVLNKTQYINSIQDLFGEAVLQSVTGQLSALSDVVNDLDSFERQSLISSSVVNSYNMLAESISDIVVADLKLREKVFGSCSLQSSPPLSCIENYIDNFSTKILRRPLTETEKTFVRSLANGSGDFKVNFASVLAYHLQSPYFLWRLELGSENSQPDEKINLSQYDIASRISFSATDSIPDEALFLAAKGGELSSLAAIKSHTMRLLKSPRGQKKVSKALNWWAQSDRTADLSQLPSALLNGVTLEGISEAMTSEAEEFVQKTIFVENGSFRDLLTSRVSYAKHPGLAAIYGHAPALQGSAQFNNRRQGLLMRAPFLSHNSGRTPLIHRGVHFQKRFLCNTIPSPTVDIADDRESDALSHDELLSTSNREAIAHQTRSSTCMGCHSVINPTGFLFENFDPLGRIRQSEKIFDNDGVFVRDISVITNTEVPLSGGEWATMSDAFDLITYVATSEEGSACVTKNLFRYFNEKKESAQDSCELNRTFELIKDDQRPIIEALTELIANEHIGEKVYSP